MTREQIVFTYENENNALLDIVATFIKYTTIFFPSTPYDNEWELENLKIYNSFNEELKNPSDELLETLESEARDRLGRGTRRIAP